MDVGAEVFAQMDFSGEEALYQQLVNYIIQEIACGMLSEGDSLPSVRQMAGIIGMNMHTVNKAYGILRQQGFVTIDRRHGAVVSVNMNREKALEELEEGLTMTLARCTCRCLSRDDVHELVDQMYDYYEKEGN